MRGYCGIGIVGGKTPENLGTLWRTAHAFGAAFVFTVGGRYRRQPSDTTAVERHLPLWQFETLVSLREYLPRPELIGIEIDDRAEPLAGFRHPGDAVYVLGAEDHGLSPQQRGLCDALVQLPGSYCLNVAVAGSIALYDRAAKAAT